METNNGAMYCTVCNSTTQRSGPFKLTPISGNATLKGMKCCTRFSMLAVKKFLKWTVKSFLNGKHSGESSPREQTRVRRTTRSLPVNQGH